MDPRINPVVAAAPSSARPPSQLLQQVLGYLFAAGCLLWVIHDVSLREVIQSSSGIRWEWIVLAVVFDVLAYLCQGVRWHLLLVPLGELPVWRATQAIYVGLFSNEILPLRVGELVRGYLVSRWIPASFVAVIPSIAVERFFDGVWLAIGIGLTALFVPLPKDLLEAGDALGVVILLATALIVFLVFHYEDKLAAGTRELAGGGKLRASLGHMAAALQTLGRSKGFYLAFAVSLPLLLLQALALWAVMLGYGLAVSFWIGLVVLLIIHLGTAIPNAPANLGTYQFFCVVGLTLFGIGKAQATGLSMVAFAVLTIPLWVIGLLALSRTGTSLRLLRQEVNRLLARRTAGENSAAA